MRKFYFLLSLIIAAIVVSCSKDSLSIPDDPKPISFTDAITLTTDEAERLALFEDSYIVPGDSILIRASRLLEKWADQSPDTRSAGNGAAILSDSVVFALSPVTRSAVNTPAQLPDEAKIYVVNFEGGGWVLMAADKRVKSEILAFSDTGSFELDTDNPGIPIAIDGMKDYVVEEITRLESMRGDKIYLSLQERYGFGNAAPGPDTRAYYPHPEEYDIREGLPGSSADRPYGTPQGSNWQVVTNGIAWYWAPVDEIRYNGAYSDYDLLKRVTPLLQSEWGQGWPYDVEVVKFYAGCPAGCIATATAQIMNYHKKGAGYLWDQYVYNIERYMGMGHDEYIWENKSQAVIDNIGKLFWDIGSAVNMVYQPHESGSSSTYVPPYLRKLGYQASNSKMYDPGWIEIDLLQNLPVYIHGYDANGSGGHAWVLDGLAQVCRFDTEYRYCYYRGEFVGYIKTVTIDYTTDQKYWHVNWGWDGRSNGWYYEGSFVAQGKNYNINVQIITNIR